MSERKYTCPHCGQHIAYTEDYSGLQLPCPRCQTAVIFPGLATPRQTSSLRLAGATARSKPGFKFSFAAIIKFLRDFEHWKIVGMCAIPFALVAGAVLAASAYNERQTPPPTTSAVEISVDPKALDKLTDLTRADQVVQEKLAAVTAATATCKAAEQKQQQARSLRPPPSAATLQMLDASTARAHLSLTAARKAFDAAFAQYQKLGGTIDYRSQLP